jgi:hypothetical protein
MSAATSHTTVPPLSGHASDAELTLLLETGESAQVPFVAAHVDSCGHCTERLGTLAIEVAVLRDLVAEQRSELEAAFLPSRFKFPIRSVAVAICAVLTLHIATLITGVPITDRVYALKHAVAEFLQAIPALRTLSQLAWQQGAGLFCIFSIVSCITLLAAALLVTRRISKQQLSA